jgi:mono/diheme cytochrome c family protein
MSRRVFVPLVSLMWMSLAVWAVLEAAGPQGQPSSPTTVSSPDYRAVVDKYCVTCHNERARTAGLMLDKTDLSNVPGNAEVWEKVVRKLRVGMMPPQGMPRPDQTTHDALVSWLETALDRAAAAAPNPGRPLAHRLNRAEYAAAIRDLLTLDVDVTSLLPLDDSSYGFDNVADVLGVSPVLVERYLAAAGRISAVAVGDPEILPNGEVFRVRQDRSQDRHVEGLPLGTVGGLLVRPTLPLDGEYTFQVRLFRTNLGTMRGLEYPQHLEYTVDGERVHLAAFGGNTEIKASSNNPTIAGDEVDARFAVRLNLRAGPHVIGAAFLEKTAAQNTRRLQPYVRSSSDTVDFSGYPHIDTFTITGPFNGTGPGDTPSRRRIFVCRPTSSSDEEPCARKIIGTLARRAYRGQATDPDLHVLMDFYRSGRRKGSFDQGIDMALRRILASPKFLVRVERDPEHSAPGTVYRISDIELASRLSFFLWSSIPDDQLLQVASRGKLKNAAVLEQQVRRMLADSRAQAMVSNFAGQWLYLRNLRNKTPNSNDFPDFDDNLREAFQRETEMFFESIIQEDRNVLDLLTANYTFMNERLAKHYGVPNIYGSHFRRVSITDETRKGLLGQGSILMVTSHADRTSPVLRGKWVLDNLLGAPPPAPPANVPPLNEDGERQGKVLTMRERMEEHRANPVCASCHKLMDPIGFALENFDPVGAWRTLEGGTGGPSIDASGQLMDGSKVDGPVALRQALLRQPNIFVGTMTEKLLTYALGRGLTYSDMPVVRGIVRDASRQDYRFTSLILGIVESMPFQMRITAPLENDALPLKSAAR